MSLKKLAFLGLTLILVLGLISGCGVEDGDVDQNSQEQENVDNSVDNDVDNDKDDVADTIIAGLEIPETVVTVNDEDLSREEFVEQFDMVKGAYEEQDIPMESDFDLYLVEFILRNMISDTMIIQYAEDQGISVNEDEVDEEYSRIKSQFESEEEFKETKAEFDYSQSELRERVHKLITMQKAIIHYVDNNIDDEQYELDEESISQAFDVFSGQLEDSAEHEEVDIEGLTEHSKIVHLVNSFIQELWDESEIEFYVDQIEEEINQEIEGK